MGWGMEGCAQENIVLDYEVSSGHHIKMITVDIVTAILKYNSHTIIIHLFVVYNSKVFSIFRAVQTTTQSNFRTLSSSQKGTQ